VSARSGMEVAVSGGRPARLLGSEEQLLVYRIVQEAVRNAERHARARRIGIELRESRDRLEVRVADDGCGFRTGESGAELLSRGKLGLMGMRERAHLLGGGIRIDSEPGRGTEVVLTLDG